MKRLLVVFGTMLLLVPAVLGQLADGAKTETGGVLPTLGGTNNWSGDNNFSSPPKVDNKDVVVEDTPFSMTNLLKAVYVNTGGSDVTGDGSFGNPYKTVKYALTTNAIPSSDITNKWGVFIAPGVYLEDNPITGRAYVNIVAMGDTSSTRIQAQNTSSPIFEAVEDTFFYGISFWGATNSSAISMTNSGISVARHCSFVDCKYGFSMDNANAIADLDNLSGFGLTIPVDRLINITAGKATIKDPVVVALSAVNYLVYVTGSNSVADINNPVSASPSLGYGVWAASNAAVTVSGGRLDGGAAGSISGGIMCDGAHMDVSALAIKGAIVGVETRGNDEMHLQAVSIENCTTGILFTGTTDAILAAVSVQECTKDMVTVGSNVSVTGSGLLLDESKMDLDPDSTINIAHMSNLAGDEGLLIKGELHVGSPESPKETVMGGGDSYTRDMLVYSYNGSTYSNISAIAASSSGSTFGFANTNANTALYLSTDVEKDGEPMTYPGLKMSVDSAIDLGAGLVVYEYWNGAWTAFNYMISDANAPYNSYAEEIFNTNGSFQMRYDNAMLDDWVKNDPAGLGRSNYWTRARIVTPITTSMQLEQLKISVDRTEVNADGFVEYFGAAEPVEDLFGASFVDTKALVGLSPIDEDIDYGTVLDFLYIANEFANNATDGRGSILTVPDGLDTSRDLTFEITLAPVSSTTTGDVGIVFYYGAMDDTTVLDGTNPEIAMTNNVTIGATADVQYKTSFTIPANTLVPGDRIPFGYTRPSGDPYGGNIYIIDTRMYGYHWK